jgi:hypothetical protein
MGHETPHPHSLTVRGLALALIISGCVGAGPSPVSVQTTIPPATTVPRPLTLADAAQCPRTEPRQAPAEFADLLFGGGSAHGDDSLWVGGLWPDGIVAVSDDFVETDGSIGMKFGWWRIDSGDLVITGRRLDGSSPPLAADVVETEADAGFVASRVYFPTEGCWEVTGSLDDVQLTFVTFVIRAA